MDQEELLNPEGKYRSGMETCNDEEIIKSMQSEDTEGDIHDNQGEAGPQHIVICREVLQAAEVLKRFASDCTEDWACNLEGILMKITYETCSEIAKSMHSTKITSYFTPKSL